MKWTAVLFCVLVFLSSTTVADVRLEILDLSTRAVRLTYELEDNQAGNRVFLFPDGGFIHSASRELFQVESVFDKNSKQELEFEVLEAPDKGLPQLRITYPEPIKEGSKKLLSVSVCLNLPDKDLLIDAAGRYVFSYETSHPFEFVVPANHYVVYTNQAMMVFERGPNIVLSQSDKYVKNIVIKTRIKN
ncbi:MAG: hypothetical protein C4527_25190 [Candidatus Omnitrophota bacterium]|jgi:hypothetical protein|nr:MAG: hypothetical protein C4527_25190 [Candidatus Omnitrophota bacterium]